MSTLEQHLPYALQQFQTDVIIPLEVFGVDVSFTTSSSAKLTTVLLLILYFLFALRERALVPGRLQSSAEAVYLFVSETVTKVAGVEARSAVPFVFCLFTFVWFGTLLGLTPIKDTFTSHLAVTLALSCAAFLYVNFVAFRKQGAGFFRFFLPAGIPWFAAPVFVLVEAISYLFRPITLGFRIFANIVAGHIMLKLFADFCAMLVGGLGLIGLLASVAPLTMIVILYAFEVMIVTIQSYIFILVTSMYLRDAVRPH